MNIEEYIMDREEFLTIIIPEYEDVITFYEDYGILLREWGLNNDILDEDIDENLAIIIKDLEDYYGDQFLPCIFEEFFEVDNIPNDLYDIFID